MLSTIDVLLTGSLRDTALARFQTTFAGHQVAGPSEVAGLPEETRARIRGLAAGSGGIDRAVMEALPNLEIIASFGVGYDSIDAATAAERGIMVTNTPDVLTEEVADTALGLLLMTARKLSEAERFLRAGRWPKEGDIPPIPTTLRNRTVGIAGLGRIGEAVARRLDAMQVPVVYHNRSRKDGVAYRYYADIVAMAADVDTLVGIMPGGAATRHIINAEVLAALGSDGILVNVGRGSSVDEQALVAALENGTIHAAGLDVFETEPTYPEALCRFDNAVLLPHVGSNTAFTRDAMCNLVVENLMSWFEKGKPVTPVAETPWPRA